MTETFEFNDWRFEKKEGIIKITESKNEDKDFKQEIVIKLEHITGTLSQKRITGIPWLIGPIISLIISLLICILLQSGAITLTNSDGFIFVDVRVVIILLSFIIGLLLFTVFLKAILDADRFLLIHNGGKIRLPGFHIDKKRLTQFHKFLEIDN